MPVCLVDFAIVGRRRNGKDEQSLDSEKLRVTFFEMPSRCVSRIPSISKVILPSNLKSLFRRLTTITSLSILSSSALGLFIISTLVLL